MTTHTITPSDDDTIRVPRPAPSYRTAVPRTEPLRPRRPRLHDMDLDPPSGPVPGEVLAYFEAAVARESEREAA
ncbi:MAG: hypothetical protein AB7V42_05070 [Thermoleophilia bacterium]